MGLPTPLAIIVFGKNLANVVLSFASMLVGYAFVSLVLGHPLPIADPLGFAVSVVLTLVSLVALGLILAPLALFWGVVLLHLDLSQTNLPGLGLTILLTAFSTAGLGLLLGYSLFWWFEFQVKRGGTLDAF